MQTETQPRRLYRSRAHRVVAGVAGGIGEYFDIDPVPVRIALALFLVAGSGPFAPLVYALMAVVIPQAPRP